jgi:hypothetical protein
VERLHPAVERLHQAEVEDLRSSTLDRLQYLH